MTSDELDFFFFNSSDDRVSISGTGLTLPFLTIDSPVVAVGCPDRKSSIPFAIKVHFLPSSAEDCLDVSRNFSRKRSLYLHGCKHHFQLFLSCSIYHSSFKITMDDVSEDPRDLCEQLSSHT